MHAFESVFVHIMMQQMDTTTLSWAVGDSLVLHYCVTIFEKVLDKEIPICKKKKGYCIPVYPYEF